MDGVLIVDKPVGPTSHDVVGRVRRILGTRRVGHTGTLDPFASGVMTVVVGQATRLARFVEKDEKEYIAAMTFGFETDTGDVTGVPKGEPSSPSVEMQRLDAALSKFRGAIDQVPPMYSAKKVDGKKLYELARAGTTIERSPIRVEISELEIDSFDEAAQTHSIRVVCSAGTYIRTLAEDIARHMGERAHLTALRRVRSGKFSLAESIGLDALEALDEPNERLLPSSTLVGHLKKVALAEDRVAKTLNGLSTRIDGGGLANGESVRIMFGDRLLAIGVFDAEASEIRPVVVLG